MTVTKRVVVIEGEDAAPEAMRPSVALLQGLGLPIEWDFPPVGLPARESHGSFFPEAARAAIDAADATLFGATSGPSGAAVSYLRWGKQTFANVRPARWMPGCNSPLKRPEEVDFVIVRENLEDMYVRVEGDLQDLAPLELVSATARRGLTEMGRGRYAIKVITEERTLAVTRFSFELARRRHDQGHAGKLTVGTKHNMLPGSDGYFLEVARSVAPEYPDIPFESYIIDDFARRLIAEPGSLDVVLLPNLYGDVLSDAAAGLIGGLGLAPSGCYGESYAYFESAHGTAPDIAGRNIINPTATLLSAAMMLDYLDFAGAATALRSAIETVYAEGRHLTPDQGGSASTTEFCDVVASRIR
jgi:isocitrate/isopropylmalate dehydrogenase